MRFTKNEAGSEPMRASMIYLKILLLNLNKQFKKKNKKKNT